MAAESSVKKRDAFRREVDRAMKARYGIDWRDACGDDGPLDDALAAAESAESFVRRWGEKYGLEPIRR